MKTKYTLHLLLFCSFLISSTLINAQCHIDDWTALKAFYEATDGNSWFYSSGWEIVDNNEPPLDCDLGVLYGVGLDEFGRVDSINLYNHYGLKGYIPSEIENLTQMKFLDLGANELKADIPPQLGNLSSLKILKLRGCSLTGNLPKDLGKLTNLEELYIKLNDITGEIPLEIGNLVNLKILDLYANKLNGSIPPQLGNLKKLEYLYLWENQLSGSIPPELGNLENLIHLELSDNELSQNIPAAIGKLSNLQHLDLIDNQLTGSIPPEIGDLRSLTKILLHRNELSGSLPPELSKLEKLESLRLMENNITGNIPPEFGNLSSLKDLLLYGNKLIGNIPPQLGNLDSLNRLELNDNKLTGNIPLQISNLHNLTTLVLNNNHLSDSIPAELGELSNLQHLLLQNNQLNGNIPPQIGKLNNLYNLDFSLNKLTGTIPPELGNLNRLGNLNLSSNQLDGNIPPEIGSITYLGELYLNNNQLTGNVPSEISNLHSLDYLILNNNRLSGNMPDLGGTQGIRGLDLSYNLYQCGEIENINFIDWETPYEFDCAFDCINVDIPYLRPKPFYYYSPQNYQYNTEKTFFVDASLQSIQLKAPFNQSGNFSYQWYKNEMPIDGATNPTLVLNNIQLDDVGNYQLHVTESICITGFTYISDPISVRRTDLEGCTDSNACNYNEFAMVDDGLCEYIWCDTLTNPIKIRTTNETILSNTQIKFDLVIDSLGLDYSADGLIFTLDMKRNYRIESIEVISPVLSVAEVDFTKLYKSVISINRINKQRLTSNEPIISVTGCIVADEIPTDESTCSHFVISGGTTLASGHFIHFDNIYIDIPFSDCSPYGGYGADGDYEADGENWLPLVLTTNPQNCNTGKSGLAEIKILDEGQSPFAYTFKDENGLIVLESISHEKLIEVSELNAGNYELTVFDMDGKKTTMHTCIPLVNSLAGNENCNTNCIDYVSIPDGEITGTHQAKKEIEIKGFVGNTETIEFKICD